MFTHKKCEQVKKHFKVGIICPEIRWLNDLIVAMVFHTVADFCADDLFRGVEFSTGSTASSDGSIIIW